MSMNHIADCAVAVNNVSALSDMPSCTAAELKATFDKTGADLKAHINSVVNGKVNEIIDAVNAMEAGTVSSIDASAITSGTIAAARLPQSGISGNAITTGAVGANYVAPLPASKITSGTLSAERIPTIPVSKGGTGATTAGGALTALGAASAEHTHTAADVGAAAASHTHSPADLEGSIPNATAQPATPLSWGTADPTGWGGTAGYVYFKVI